MSRSTIDFGIDLGTTNSSISVVRGADVEVFRNNEGAEYTPSAVWIDKKERLYVGSIAKKELVRDPGNAFAEFKQQMGTAEQFVFERSGRKMRPEDLSAEVLKSLKHDVRQKMGEDVMAAVITVPAAFEHPQCDATNKAARAAGFAMSPLVQEPVAAALAYGFQAEQDKAFWLVYDFGGGTFDAAVVQVRDGSIHVVNHSGDNKLGGKLLDWAIVEQLLIPAVTREHRLTDFKVGSARWLGAIATLKWAAEEAKIRLSREDSVTIDEDLPDGDSPGKSIPFEFELSRSDMERLFEPFILRSINICKRALAEKRLDPAAIQQILLVGGPTLSPYLRERLADSTEGLGIQLNYSIDPLTVVSRGAAIFAAGQRLEVAAPKVAAGQYAIALEYSPVGSDVDPLVGGRVIAPEGSALTGCTIEFVNVESRPPWRSGRITVGSDGTFITNLLAEPGRQNRFEIQLMDSAGRRLNVAPAELTYTVGMAIADPPLIHAVGIAMANNEVDLVFAKGTPLPAHKRVVHRTAFECRRGYADHILRIPVVEGESIRRADRNRLIGELVVDGAELKRDLPAGSEVEITIDIDQSRLVRATAYVPLLDEEYEGILQLEKPAPDPTELERDAQREKARLTEMRTRVAEVGDTRARAVIDRIDGEKTQQQIDMSLAAAPADRSAAQTCEGRLLDLRVALDEAEDALEWPALVQEATTTLELTDAIVREHGSADDRANLATVRSSWDAALQSHDADLLRQKIDELNDIRFPLVFAQPAWWVGYLAYLKEQRGQMRQRAQADQLIIQGERAIAANDLDGLKAACNQLVNLLPQDEQEKARGYGGTTVNR